MSLATRSLSPIHPSHAEDAPPSLDVRHPVAHPSSSLAPLSPSVAVSPNLPQLLALTTQNHNAATITTTPNANPIPIPAFAPALRPPPPPLARAVAVPVPVPIPPNPVIAALAVVVVNDPEEILAVAVSSPTDAVAAKPHVCTAAAWLCRSENAELWRTGPQSGEPWL